MAVSELFGKQTLPGGATPLGVEEKSIPAPKDEFAGFEPADEFSGFEAAPDEFSGFKQADDLDLQDVDLLDKNREKFNPKAYFSQNPDVAKEPKKLQKLLEVYKRRRKEGLKAGEVAKAVVTETPGLVGGIAKGVRDLGARVLDVTVQPVANIALGALTGELSDPARRKAFKEEGRKSIRKAFGEIGAGSEAAAAGIADIGRQGVRKIAGVPDDEQELLRQLSDDVEFQKQAATILKGGGEAAKAVGLDADTLKSEGITLDEKAIENLSLVDPVTLVATGGIFKVVGLGGKIIGTAATKAGATALVSKLGNLAKQTVGKTVKGTGSAVQAVGGAGKAVAERVPAKAIGAVVGGGSTGTLAGAAVGAAAGEATKRVATELAEQVVKTGGVVKQFGQQLIGEAPKSAGLQRIQSILDNQITRGAVKGAAAGVVGAAPLAAAVDDDKTAGALLGAGIALGTAGGALAGAKQALASKISKSQFDRNAAPVPNVESPGYGKNENFDVSHDASIKQLSQSEQANINNMREALRDVGVEIYSQDPLNYEQRILENMESVKGAPLDASELAAGKEFAKTNASFDPTLPDKDGNVRRVVFLNGDSKGLFHDVGHVFHSLLSPDRQAELRKSVKEFYSEKQIAEGKAEYESRLGTRVDADYFLNELIAENYNALFNNVPLTDLNAPKGFLKELGQQSLDVAEALGIDLKAGAVTPDLKLSPSYRLRTMLESGAREVLQHAEAAKGTGPRVTPKELVPEGPRELIPGEVELAPRSAEPVATVPVPDALRPKGAVTIPTVAPEPTARNIRATRAQQNDFAAKRAEVTGIAEAKAAAEKNTNPNVMAQVEAVSGHMESGNPVLEIEHGGVKAAGTEAAPSGRTSRRTEQEAAYIAEGMGAVPATIRDAHQKTFVPVRWEVRGSEPQLIAMSLDKVIANIHRAVKDAVAVRQGDLIPYEQADGKLTETGWKQAVADIQAYAENQANGFKGDGGPLTRPTEDTGISIPAENPDFRPNTLTPGRANFANLVMGLAPPKTARVTGKATPGNIKGQLLAELNKRTPETPAKIAPGDLAKQEFKGYTGRSVKETNPLRNQLAKAGAPVRELIEVTERVNAGDIQTVKPRPDIQFRAPVTDIIRGGFLPADLGPEIQKMPAEEWKAFTESGGGSLTKKAYELGLGLKDKADLNLLRQFQASANDLATKAVQQFRETGSDVAMQEASLNGLKSQFFREAAEAATDTGSAANPRMGWRRTMPDAKPPFAELKLDVQFLPKTEKGKKLAKEGFDFEITGKSTVRGVAILKDGTVVGAIQSVRLTPERAEIANVILDKKNRGTGAAEAAYRELLTQLKEDGVTEVGGRTVAPEPLAIRKKIFGKFDKLELNAEPVDIDTAIAKAAELKAGSPELIDIEATNKITPEMQFLPKKREFVSADGIKNQISELAEKGRKGGKAGQPQSEFTRDLLKREGWNLERSSLGDKNFMFRISNGKNLVGDLSIYLDSEVENFAEVGHVETIPEYRNKGVAEALYREAANELQKLGITRLGGNFLTQAPMNLRKKLFGEFEFLGDDLKTFDEAEARERLPESPAESLDEAVGRRTGKVEGVSTIDPEMQFLPRLPKRENYGYVGEVNNDGEVVASAVNLATTSHGDRGLLSMWRYNPQTKKVYWWAVEDLNKHGERVKDELEANGHEVVGQVRIMQSPKAFEEAHASSAKFDVKDFFPELRKKEKSRTFRLAIEADLEIERKRDAVDTDSN